MSGRRWEGSGSDCVSEAGEAIRLAIKDRGTESRRIECDTAGQRRDKALPLGNMTQVEGRQRRDGAISRSSGCQDYDYVL